MEKLDSHPGRLTSETLCVAARPLACHCAGLSVLVCTLGYSVVLQME